MALQRIYFMAFAADILFNMNNFLLKINMKSLTIAFVYAII